MFFDLPYWCKLNVKHCMNIMNVEKNVYNNLIRTVLNIKGMIKNGLNAYLDLIKMNMGEYLAPT